MDASFSDTESKNLLEASRRLLPRAIVLNTREQVLEALELGLERAKIFGRVIVNSWTGNDEFGRIARAFNGMVARLSGRAAESTRRPGSGQES